MGDEFKCGNPPVYCTNNLCIFHYLSTPLLSQQSQKQPNFLTYPGKKKKLSPVGPQTEEKKKKASNKNNKKAELSNKICTT